MRLTSDSVVFLALSVPLFAAGVNSLGTQREVHTPLTDVETYIRLTHSPLPDVRPTMASIFRTGWVPDTGLRVDAPDLEVEADRIRFTMRITDKDKKLDGVVLSGHFVPTIEARTGFCIARCANVPRFVEPVVVTDAERIHRDGNEDMIPLARAAAMAKGSIEQGIRSVMMDHPSGRDLPSLPQSVSTTSTGIEFVYGSVPSKVPVEVTFGGAVLMAAVGLLSVRRREDGAAEDTNGSKGQDGQTT